ncbi:hypothetical protein JB92DRAFT_768054 [Gautieria morchelliformis]|nr:hypothetical protein JB92DRAFT_768054 [Gautieria morchelliformis]
MANVSNTFSRPPIDGTLTVDQLYYWHRVHSPRVAAFVFPKENGLQVSFPSSINYVVILTLSKDHLNIEGIADGITKGAEIIQSSIPESQGTNNRLQQRDPIVVGIVAASVRLHVSITACTLTPYLYAIDVITYTTYIFSHIRLTHPSASGRPLLPFPISPRNSAAAVAHLVHTPQVLNTFGSQKAPRGRLRKKHWGREPW